MKKLLSLLLTFITAFGSLLTGAVGTRLEASAEDNACGLSCTWSIDTQTRTLTISGTGSTFDYDSTEYVEWQEYQQMVSTIVVEEGITRIGAYFLKSSWYTKLVLPSTLEWIDSGNFGMDIKEIVIPENNSLKYIAPYALEATKWYKSKPDGPVYLGNVLYKYKGTVPENTVLFIPENVVSISAQAFSNQSGLIDIKTGGNIEYIGGDAFKGTTWLASQPIGVIYVDKVLYGHNGALTFDERNYRIREGTVSVSDKAFYRDNVLTEIYIPASVERIGEDCFSLSSLKSVEIAENSQLKALDRAAFYSIKIQSISLPDGLEILGKNAIAGCSLLEKVEVPASVYCLGVIDAQIYSTEWVIDKNNPYYMTENGIIYSKDKTRLIRATGLTQSNMTVADTVKEICASAFAHYNMTSIVIPDSVEKIGEFAFAYSDTLERIEIPAGVKSIGGSCFAYSRYKEIVVYSVDAQVKSDTYWNATETVICYEGSTTETVCKNNSVPYRYFSEEADLTQLLETVQETGKIDRSLYTAESLGKLDTALNAVVLDPAPTQEQADLWLENINKAKAGLEYKPADYTAVEAAILKAGETDRKLYTSEWLEALDSAVKSVEYGLDITQQGRVDAFALNIEQVIGTAEYLPADYTAVEAELGKAERIDRILYTSAGLEILDQNVKAVVYGLDITQQGRVNSFADGIGAALSALSYAAVTLRNDENGVIVSSTAKEIYPTTTLTVDMIDPSVYDIADFAVGGRVTSAKYYDITLILGGRAVQPAGTVTVKIKIPDGVDPQKCRVYHVTDDPVSPLVKFSSALDGSYIVFETDHFSEFALVEVETVVSSVEITSLPEKTVYALGDSVSTEGMTVTAFYSDGTSAEVKDFDISSVDTGSVGEKTVTVYYTYGGVTKTASFTVTVDASAFSAFISNGGERIKEYVKKVPLFGLYSSQSVKLDCLQSGNGKNKVVWSSDNKKISVDSNGNVTTRGLFGARKGVITATVLDSSGKVIATDKITVCFYKLAFQLSRLMGR